MSNLRVTTSLMLCLAISACVSPGEDDAITLENGEGKADGARLHLDINATNKYQRLELICDSPSGCDVTASLQFYNPWGKVALEEPAALAIAQIGATLEQASANQYFISTAGDLTDPDATRSYYFARGNETTLQPLPDGMLEINKTIPQGTETIAVGRGGSTAEEFSVAVSVSWTPHPAD